jgi:hypothetical protein
MNANISPGFKNWMGLSGMTMSVPCGIVIAGEILATSQWTDACSFCATGILVCATAIYLSFR